MKTFLTAAAVAALTMFAVVSTAHAETPEHIDRSSDAALQQLYDTNPAARAIAEHARAILVFPASSRPASSSAAPSAKAS